MEPAGYPQDGPITMEPSTALDITESAGIYLFVDREHKPLLAGQTENLLGRVSELLADGNHSIWHHAVSDFFIEEIADEAERRRRESEMLQNLQPVCN